MLMWIGKMGLSLKSLEIDKGPQDMVKTQHIDIIFRLHTLGCTQCISLTQLEKLKNNNAPWNLDDLVFKSSTRKKGHKIKIDLWKLDWQFAM